jgi:hypothetical protein
VPIGAKDLQQCLGISVKKIANFVMMGQKKHGNPNYNFLSAWKLPPLTLKKKYVIIPFLSVSY